MHPGRPAGRGPATVAGVGGDANGLPGSGGEPGRGGLGGGVGTGRDRVKHDDGGPGAVGRGGRNLALAVGGALLAFNSAYLASTSEPSLFYAWQVVLHPLLGLVATAAFVSWWWPRRGDLPTFAGGLLLGLAAVCGLAVVVVGAWLGPRDGALALALYVVVGALGVPVFADGAGGPGHLVGPTLGYLLSFVAGAALMGWWVRRPWARPGWGRVALAAFAGALLAHGVILLLGWVRFGALVGPVEAFASGVRPFLAGGVAKSAAAALIWLVIRSRMEPGDRPLYDET